MCRQSHQHPQIRSLNLFNVRYILAYSNIALVFGTSGSFFQMSSSVQLFASRLIANLDKSVVFFGGIKDTEQQQILDILGFSQGTLPIKYLGIPLSSKRLNVGQCAQLLEKMLGRITSWTSKLLTYAGRVQLIMAVLFSILICWSQIFVLPEEIVKKIEVVCRQFLWTGTVRESKNALIA
ncbi:uncharacterized protein LOC132038097 [Lycium ferocissimum]|uniref:uncharacterized protein LOC132038097 n=1 Tax=Lycium ferocissimum TaxID=112874 RepID=UPI0028168884|nr:uncharacterized protein LOC132038097 [Lycium ferocissimum]